jgi:hypothetical protein
VAGSCEYGDEPAGSGATEIVRKVCCRGNSVTIVSGYELDDRDSRFDPW